MLAFNLSDTLTLFSTQVNLNPIRSHFLHQTWQPFLLTSDRKPRNAPFRPANAAVKCVAPAHCPLFWKPPRPTHHGRHRRLRDRRVRRLQHLPHPVLRAAQERLRGDEGTALQDRRDVHLQDRQARTCQGQPGRHRHLLQQEVRGRVPLHTQHGRAPHQEDRVAAAEHHGRLHVPDVRERRPPRGPAPAGGGPGQGDPEQVREQRRFLGHRSLRHGGGVCRLPESPVQ